jgi:hypothetical protein
MVIKLNTWTPDTCEAPPCRVIIRFDTDAVPHAPEIVGYEQICAAHADAVPTDKILWSDGNWKDRDAYHSYQRDWFRWRSVEKFKAENPGAPLPAKLQGHETEPPTSGSVPAPSAAELTAKGRVDGWVNGHNGRKNQCSSWIESNVGEGRWADVTWWFTGVGDARVLHIDSGGALNNQQRNALQAFCDVQFGPGKVIVEG